MPNTAFTKLFTALTGTSPFPWQQSLYEGFARGKIPSIADLPTGLGKTSVVAIWLIALLTHPDKVPRRLVYVVNRRTVVDQTTAEVERLRKRLRACLGQQFQPKQVLVEIPIATTNETGQRIEGFIDMLVETGNGWILIDHKSFPGKRSEWSTEAVSYSGQLALYREALNKLKLPVTSVWIHFAVGGGLVEVQLNDKI